MLNTVVCVTVCILVAGAVGGCGRDEGCNGVGGTQRVVTLQALANAVNNDQVKELDELLTNGGNPNAVMLDGTTVLHGAVSMNRTECVAVLLRHGANVAIADQRGQTPLHKATYYSFDNPVVVAALLKAGSKPELQDNAGKTALDYAKENSHLESIKILRERSNPAVGR